MRAFVLQLPFSMLLLLLGLAGGCSTDKVDITRDWSAERIYYAARDELTRPGRGNFADQGKRGAPSRILR